MALILKCTFSGRVAQNPHSWPNPLHADHALRLTLAARAIGAKRVGEVMDQALVSRRPSSVLTLSTHGSADVAGDVCRSVFHKIAAMSANDRFDLYGGAVFVIGVVQANDLLGSRTSSEGGRDPYLSLVPLDFEGREVRNEAKR